MVPFLTFFVEELGVVDASRRNLWAATLVAAAPLSAAFMGPVWGAVGDRFGRKLMVLRGMGAILLFVGLMSFARDPWMLLVLRIFQGLFSGYGPPAMTLASLHVPRERRARTTAILQAAMPAGSVTGYMIGGWLLEHHGMSTVFPLCAGLSALALVVVWLFVDDIPIPQQHRGVSLLAVLRQVPADFRTTLAIPTLASLLLCVMAVRAFGSCVDPNLARFLVDELGTSKTHAGTVFACEALAFLFGTPIFGRLSDGWGPRRTFALATALLSPVLFFEGHAETAQSFLLLRLLHGFLMSGIMPAAYAMAVRETEPEQRGQAIGTVFMGLVLAHGLGSALGGPLLNVFGFRTLFHLIGGLCLLLALVVIRMVIKGKRMDRVAEG